MNKWDSRSVGKPWQHRFFYLVIRYTGRYTAYLFMYFVVLWYILFYPPVHQRCRPYLSRRFPDAANWFTRLFHEYRWITSLGRSLIDRAAYGIRGEKTMQIDVPDGIKLKELLEEGKGLIIISAHTGCWQVAFSALHFLKSNVHIVMYRDQNDVDKHYYEYKGKSPPFNIIDPSDYLGGTLQMTAALQQGEILGLMGDRVFGQDRNTVQVSFLDDPVRIPIASYRLAATMGTPIAVVFSHKSNASDYIVELAEVIRIKPGIDRNPETYTPYAQQYMTCLETFTQKHPFEYFNFYDIWESPGQQQKKTDK